jgi:hypothetical protein
VALDTIALPSKGKLAWQLDDPMPLVGLRSELCVQGAPAGAMLQVAGLAQHHCSAVVTKLMPLAPQSGQRRQAGWR